MRRMFAAFAQFERDQPVERTHAGLARAKENPDYWFRLAERDADLQRLLVDDLGW